MTSSQPRRTKIQLNSVVAPIKDSNDHWVPTTFSTLDWVYMQPSGKGIHRVAKRKRDNKEHHWRGRIHEFKVDCNGDYLARVQHVYMRRDILLDTAVADRNILSHCKSYIFECQRYFTCKLLLLHSITSCADVFPSDSYDWQHVKSFTGKFSAIHAKYGVLIYDGLKSSAIIGLGVYFYDHMYEVPKKNFGTGKLLPLSEPTIDSHDWPYVDELTIELTKFQLVKEITMNMKPTFGSKRVYTSVSVPVAVFVAIFKTIPFRKTNTLWVWKATESSLLDNVFTSWDSRNVDHKGDLIRCDICRETMTIRYHIARQTCSFSFVYRRFKFAHGRWDSLDAETRHQEFELPIHMPNDEVREVCVNGEWSLEDVRAMVGLIYADVPTNFVFTINGQTVSVNNKRASKFCKWLLNTYIK